MPFNPTSLSRMRDEELGSHLLPKPHFEQPITLVQNNDRNGLQHVSEALRVLHMVMKAAHGAH